MVTSSGDKKRHQQIIANKTTKRAKKCSKNQINQKESKKNVKKDRKESTKKFQRRGTTNQANEKMHQKRETEK